MTTPTLLISGATGTTGGALIKELEAQGIAAKALVRDTHKAADLASDTISLVKGNLGDPASLKEAFQGVKAAYLNVLPGADALDHVDNFIAAAREAGVQHIVKLSGLNSGPDSVSAIMRLHAEGDRRVRESGMTYTILRSNSFFQNVLSQWEGITTNGQFFLPLGEARQSFIDVADIAAVAVKRMTDDTAANADLDLTGPQSLSLSEFADTLSSALGRDVSYVAISSEAFADSLTSSGLPQPAAQALAELFEVFASGIYADVTDVVPTILGREAITVQQFAEKMAQG